MVDVSQKVGEKNVVSLTTLGRGIEVCLFCSCHWTNTTGSHTEKTSYRCIFPLSEVTQKVRRILTENCRPEMGVSIIRMNNIQKLSVFINKPVYT